MEVFLFRIFLSGLIGMIIGINMGKYVSTARTFMIICMGSTLLTITSTEFFQMIGNSWFSDPGRLSAQVISALGFIGVGLIWMSEDSKIRGLSVAANLWNTAIIGILIGLGLIKIAALFLIFSILIGYFAEPMVKWRRKS
ncbi:MAG: MgtC/SapB family protein [Syntrophomonadaceae bacterium]|nr:MgtC/SapB family protein [Syntrophomonadaceae bacterium]